MVIALVVTKSAFLTIGSPGNGRATSSRVAPHRSARGRTIVSYAATKPAASAAAAKIHRRVWFIPVLLA